MVTRLGGKAAPYVPGLGSARTLSSPPKRTLGFMSQDVPLLPSLISSPRVPGPRPTFPLLGLSPDSPVWRPE